MVPIEGASKRLFRPLKEFNMNLKNFLLARQAMKRWVSSYKQCTFIGFNQIRCFGFKSYYFAHVYTSREYLLGIKMPHGVCLTELSF